MIGKWLLSAAALAFTATGVLAADVIEPQGFDWTGPYVGLEAGYGWDKNDLDLRNRTTTGDIGILALGTVKAEDDIKLDGIMGGLHAGYNWQMDALVLGVEGDIELSDLKGDTDVVDQGEDIVNEIGQVRQKIDWLGSLRLRAGFAADRALFYATGGLAIGGSDTEVQIFDDKEGDSDTLWGWTVGGGIEYAVTDDFTTRLEYRYTDLGDTDVDLDEMTYFDKAEFENSFHAVRVGLSWRFGDL